MSKAISVSTGPIFTISSPNGRYLREYSWSGPVFPIPQGTLPWQPILCHTGLVRSEPKYLRIRWTDSYHPCTYRSVISIRNGITPCICMMPLHHVNFLVKISLVIVAETILIEIALCVHVVVWHISSNISRRTGPNFAIFSPYESALRANDGSVPIFQLVKGRCHGNQIILPKWMQRDTACIFARLPDVSTVSFCYDLLLMPLYRVKFWWRSVQ